MNETTVAPDLLVLGSGGVLGDVWMTGVAAGLARSGRVDPAAAGAFTGTSAGSIVATRLAVGQDLEELVRSYVELSGRQADTLPPEELDREHGSHRLGRFVAAQGPTGRLIRRAALKLIPSGTQQLKYLERDMSALAPEWPARLNITAVDARSGERVVFNREDNRGLSVSQAVQASCAIPAVFRPVESHDGSEACFVDGGVWSPVNLDAVPVEPGQTVVCLTPTGSDQGAMGFRRKAVAGFFQSIVKGEVERLRRRGARIINIVPDVAASTAIGPSRMAGGREAGVYEAGLAQGLSLAGPMESWLSGTKDDVTESEPVRS